MLFLFYLSHKKEPYLSMKARVLYNFADLTVFSVLCTCKK
jgi:hypothetical protein